MAREKKRELDMDDEPNVPDDESITPKQPGEEPSDEVPDVLNFPASPADAGVTPELSAALDEDEAMLKRLTGGMPDVGEAGPGSLGVIAVDKVPTGKNAFFRAHPGIILKNVSLTVDEAGMGKAFYVVDPAMEKAVESIGIRVAKHTLYLTITQPPISVLTIVPVRSEDPIDDYSRTKEMVLLEAMTGWVRIYTDLKQRIYRSYPAPEGRFDEPKWPDLAPAKIFRMTFKDRGRLLDSVQHPAWKRWTGQ